MPHRHSYAAILARNSGGGCVVGQGLKFLSCARVAAPRHSIVGLGTLPKYGNGKIHKIEIWQRI